MLVKAPAPVVNLMAKCFELKQPHKERYRCPSFLSIRRQGRCLGIIKTTTATGSGGNNVEKLSVLGAIDDDSTSSSDVPTYTIQVHEQSAPHKISSNHAAYEDGHGEGDPPTGRRVEFRGSFGRLKVQRVKALAVKASQRRQEMDKIDHKLVVEDKPSFDKGEKKKVNVPRHRGRLSSASQLQEYTDTLQVKRTSEDITSSGMTMKNGFEPYSDYQIKPDRHQRLIKKASPVASVLTGPTASLRGWRNGRSICNFNSELPDLMRQRNLSTNTEFFSLKSFKDLGCSEYMIECLSRQLFHRPSHIQAMTFEPVIKGKTCILADQSGSGKTLAYLAPVIQRIRQEEVQGLSMSSSQSPRVIILVPTAELASQVLGNCRSMSKFGVPFRSMVVTGGFRQRTQVENLQQDVDVLIATPGRFMFLMKEGFLRLKNIRCAVLDEVDVLFNDEDFESALQSLINSSPVSTQYLFVTATLPVDIYNKLVEVFPDCEVIMGPGVHRTSPGLEEILVDCSGDDNVEKTPEAAFLNKKSALLQLVEGSSVPKTIVFCNKIETCRRVENVLKRFDKRGTLVQVLPFHAAVAQESRHANMNKFATTREDKVCQFLVCTDRASRGIDFSGVDHVVLFDFPRDPSEYVRRVGRTARGVGGKGKAFIFVVGKQVFLARKIMERNRKGHPLHDVPSF